MSIYTYFSNGNPIQGTILGILFVISIIAIPYGWYHKTNSLVDGCRQNTIASQILGCIISHIPTHFCVYIFHLCHFLYSLPLFIIRIYEGVFSPPANVLIKILVIAMCFTIFGITAYIIANLNKLYSFRRQETRITVSQIILLSIFGLCLAASIYTLGIEKDSTGSIIVSVFGAVLGWIFQDTIKSVVAFFYLRANHLLKIGDWIEVKEHGIDGRLKRISLTTVVIENWDTTTSCVPTYILSPCRVFQEQPKDDGRTHSRSPDAQNIHH